MTNEYFECQCCSFQHGFRIWLDESDGYLYIDTKLNKLPWRKRLYYGLKYILGLSTGTWSYYEETILKPEDYPRLLHLMNRAEMIRVARK